VGADTGFVKLAGGQVRELVAEDFVEEGVCVSVSVSVRGSIDVSGDADEAAVGVAPAERPGEAGGELDAGFCGEVGSVPGAKPAVEGGAGVFWEREVVERDPEG
jgi:hypothetical protein